MDEDKKKLEKEIEAMIEGTTSDAPRERVRRPDKQRPIRDIAHLNDSFYKFLSKQLLLVIATRLFKEDPKEFVNSVVEHFLEGYRRIILRKHELKEGTDTKMGDTEENQMLFSELANIEKKNELEDLKRYGEMMKKQIMDLVEDTDFFDGFNNPEDIDDIL